MQRNRLIAVTLIAAVMLMVVPLIALAAPQADDKASPAPAETVGPNLLSNPGLEGHYNQQCSQRSDPPWVPAPTACDPAKYDYANRILWATAQVPQGWAAWWRVPNANRNDPNYFNSFPDFCDGDKNSTPAGCLPWHNPEFRDTMGGPQETGPSRRMEGENSQKYFTFYTVHEAGLYQIIASGFKPGDRLRFSAYMMAWSSTENDPFHSVGQSSMGMRVGIDPTGGNNPWSPNIVWSPVQESFDKFSQFTRGSRGAGQHGVGLDALAARVRYSAQRRVCRCDQFERGRVRAACGGQARLGQLCDDHQNCYYNQSDSRAPVGTRIVTTTMIVTSTHSECRVTTSQIVTSSKVITSSTGVTSTVITTRTVTVPVATPKPSATVTPTKPLSGTQPMPASGTYTVVRGDTLIAIARRFGITPWWRLGEINGLTKPYKVSVGQVLKLK